jgi:hypothetical protein
MMNWVPITERMPDAGDEVIIAVREAVSTSVVVAVWHGSTHFWQAYDMYQGDSYPIERVTHWMPMPDAPEPRDNR